MSPLGQQYVSITGILAQTTVWLLDLILRELEDWLGSVISCLCLADLIQKDM